jgi:polysaccharide deacetylase 2 family uncharacterized protein YibQ
MESLIRFLIRHGQSLIFAGLASFGLWAGGRATVDGLPRLFGALTPGIEAKAEPTSPGVPRTITRLTLTGFPQSRYLPQMLYPVTAKTFPAWMTGASGETKPVIAICIDDLGEDPIGTSKAIRLPQAVALSFLPYAETTPAFAVEAHLRGHVVLAHIPMQAVSATDPGPMALTIGMERNEVIRRLAWSLGRVPDAVGINNHEGSRFTADAVAMEPVMQVLKARGLFFFDSRTSAASRGATAAQAAGVQYVGRDVFLDDDQSAAAVERQLEALAATAKRQGAAIAIGHPHAVTLALLAEWLNQDHGVRLVTLPEAMRIKTALQTGMAAR